MYLPLVLSIFCASDSTASPERRIQMPAPKVTLTCRPGDLFSAVEASDIKCLKSSLRQMDVNETDAAGDTPLHFAIKQKNADAIPLLIKNGADLNRINHQNQTPRRLAEDLGYRVLADYFEKLEVETMRLEAAVLVNEGKKAAASLKRGAAIGNRDTRQETLLHKAAEAGFVDVGEALIRGGADLEARNMLGETPLHRAVSGGSVSFVELLLRSGANPGAMSLRGEKPSDLIVEDEADKMLEALNKAVQKQASGR